MSFADPLAGVPSVESPFFNDIFRETETSHEFMRIARSLHEKGYAVIDFPDPLFSERAAAIIEALTPRLATGNDSPPVFQAGSRIENAWNISEHVKALASNETIMALLAKLYGRRAWPFQTLNFPMGSQQHFHTDAIHFSSVPERFMCGVWVALEDIGPQQGPLEFYPGTHKWPVYGNEHIGRKGVHHKLSTQGDFHELWEALVARAGIARETFCPRKGQTLIWAANLLHGGAAQHDPARTRWSQVTHYYFEDCAYYTPMKSDPFRGLISFREPVNIVTGEKVPNSYNGEPVPPRFLQEAPTGFTELIPREEFDAAAYLEVNQDVAAAGVDAWEHYATYGHKERRYAGKQPWFE